MDCVSPKTPKKPLEERLVRQGVGSGSGKGTYPRRGNSLLFFNFLIFIACTVFLQENIRIWIRIAGSGSVLLLMRGFRFVDRFSVVRCMASLPLHNGVLPRSGPCVDAPPYPRHGCSAQEGIVDRPGMERRAWLVFLFIFALFNSNSHQNFFTNFALVAP